ncbi:hypothetical protein Aple_013160 [Acrocarpospora pleiomorpha]|uniref:CBS domain-containing protein n=1 Tax=Acrocarpospora pleiomorpha TaxID=90975 RepID=A0A5M3XFP9_9ACTN|nr:CBS domain-containing protein [Acrocarpospora pleiomorpha]GES18421.1 hypothetical protein Aple_013160 [Acrocarpospora pleiomorpha]
MTTLPLTAADIMTRVVVTITPQESPLMAWEVMRRAGIHHIPVVDENRRLHGILSLHELATGWSGAVGDLARREARDFLNDRRLPRIQKDQSIAHVSALMLDSGRDALPVVDEQGWIAGIITTIDILKAVAGRVETTTGTGQVNSAMFRIEMVSPESNDESGHR